MEGGTGGVISFMTVSQHNKYIIYIFIHILIKNRQYNNCMSLVGTKFYKICIQMYYVRTYSSMQE